MEKQRDILLLCQFFHPEYISSAQLPYDTVRALRDAQFSVDVICGYPREYFQGGEVPVREELDGIRIRRLKYLQLDRTGTLSRLVNYFSYTLQVLLHLGACRHYRAVVVYSNPPILPWVAAWAKRLFGVKLVFVAYDLYPEVMAATGTFSQGHPICRLMNHINRQVYRRADRVVALSSEMRSYILEHRPIEAEQVRVIPNWCCEEEFPQSDREHNRFRDVTAGRFTVGYFGNMGTAQDMQTILDAMRLMKDDREVFFLLAGHGNKLERLKQVIAEEGIGNVAIYPFLHGQDFQDALAISDCALVSLDRGVTGLCVPSKTYSYMMRGLPLLAIMDEGDIVRDVEAGAGAWVRNGDGEALAAAISRMRSDPEKLAAMSKTSRRLYQEKYTAKAGTGQYVALFRELLAEA